MDITLWVVQVVLALVFLLAGFMKTSQPIDKLAKNMGFVNDFPAWSVRVIGILEILGAIGLILPPLVKIAPVLAPIAAIGLALTMVGAIIVHVQRKEFSALGTCIVFLLVALFVVYGRFVLQPFA